MSSGPCVRFVGRTELYNDILFVATYVEYISRATKTKHVDLVDYIGYPRLKHIYEYADVNHCLTLDQHLCEFREAYPDFQDGSYDVSEAIKGLSVESPSRAASPFARLVELLTSDRDEAIHTLWALYHRWIADALTDWKLGFYRQPPQYHLQCLRDGGYSVQDFTIL